MTVEGIWTAEAYGSFGWESRGIFFLQNGKTMGGDKGYDTRDFVMELRELGITPHVAQNAYDTGKAKRRSAIDGRTTRHPGYGVSQKKRKRIEEIFGWLKTIAGLRQSKFRGLERVGMSFTFALAAYNLIRMPGSLPQTIFKGRAYEWPCRPLPRSLADRPHGRV